MRLRSLVAGTALAATSVLALAAPAAAAPKPANAADVVGVVRIDPSDPTVAEVRVRYHCAAGEELGLWVSVKQSEDRSADPLLAEHGSSSYATAMSHSHRHEFTCDGRTRVGTFTVDQVEWGSGSLARGEGYVQFCLTDLSTEGPESTLVSRNEFVHVR